MEAECAKPVTARELRILGLLADGLITKQIAKHLTYSERTIKNDFVRVCRKLGVRNRTAAVALALRKGLIQ